MDEPERQDGLRAIVIEAIDVPGLTSRVHRARLFVRKRLSEYFEPEKSCCTDPVNRSRGAPHLIG